METEENSQTLVKRGSSPSPSMISMVSKLGSVTKLAGTLKKGFKKEKHDTADKMIGEASGVGLRKNANKRNKEEKKAKSEKNVKTELSTKKDAKAEQSKKEAKLEQAEKDAKAKQAKKEAKAKQSKKDAKLEPSTKKEAKLEPSKEEAKAKQSTKDAKLEPSTKKDAKVEQSKEEAKTEQSKKDAKLEPSTKKEAKVEPSKTESMEQAKTDERKTTDVTSAETPTKLFKKEGKNRMFMNMIPKGLMKKPDSTPVLVHSTTPDMRPTMRRTSDADRGSPVLKVEGRSTPSEKGGEKAEEAWSIKSTYRKYEVMQKRSMSVPARNVFEMDDNDVYSDLSAESNEEGPSSSVANGVQESAKEKLQPIVESPRNNLAGDTAQSRSRTDQETSRVPVALNGISQKKTNAQIKQEIIDIANSATKNSNIVQPNTSRPLLTTQFSEQAKRTTDKNELLYKILVIGELGTGKTSIIKRYVHQFFSQHYRATIGVDFALKVLSWDADTTIRLQLWDIAGQERFGNMTRVYYKEAVGAFIVFDVTRVSTFEAVTKWKDDLDKKVQLADGIPVPCVLLANKCDQVCEGIVSNESKMAEFCKENKFVGWFQTSAKDNINVDQAANCLVSEILQNDQKKNQKKNNIDHDIFPPENTRNNEKKQCSC